MRRGSQRRVVYGLNTHGCKPVLRNALGLSLERGSGGVAMPLSKRSQDAPEPLSKCPGGFHAPFSAGTHRVSQHCQHLL